MAVILLVHGAYHGAWCWSRVTPLLAAAGHRVLTPNLPGHGDDPTPPAAVTMSPFIAAVGATAVGAGEPIVLVGHSMAGAVVSGAAEARPEAIRRLVFLTGYIPADGESVADRVRADTQFTIPVERREAAGARMLHIAPAVMRRHFYQDATDADFDWVMAHAQDQALAPFTEPLALSAARFGTVPKAYVHCRHDRAIGLALQRRMAAKAGCDPML
ncbi:MAG: alpha/beta fold hydrolase [Rhodospirillaceae bacterium]